MNKSLIDNPYQIFKQVLLNYASLTEDEWELIAEKSTHLIVKRNEHLVSIGDVCDKVWFIAKGIIRFYQYDIDQNERTTCFGIQNQFCTPFSSYLKNTPSHEVLVALETTEIIEVAKADFQFFIETIAGINSMYRQVLEESYLQMENLNYVLQHYNALERYQKLILEDAPELLQKVPLTYLASYLGISPETLSRVRAKI